MEGVIERNGPLFLLLWLGSLVAILAAAGVGLWPLMATDRLYTLLAAALAFFGVHLPTPFF